MASGCGRHDDSSDSEDDRCGPSPAPSAQASSRELPVRPQGLGSWSRATVTIGAAAAAAVPGGPPADAAPRRCQKCNERDAYVVVRQNEPLCDLCLKAGVVGRVRAATKGRGLLEEGDGVLLALSGGAASAALLHAALTLQNRNSARPQRGRVSFQLRAAHVQVPGAAGAAAAASAAAVAAAAGVPPEGFLVVPLHFVFAESNALLWTAADANESAVQQELNGSNCSANGGAADSTPAATATQQQQQQERLEALLSAVRDPTAAEDLIVYMRQRLLRRLAGATGCNKLLLGDCASTIAGRVIADAAKGRGFSLPADIQSLDTRWSGQLQHAGQQQQQQQQQATTGTNSAGSNRSTRPAAVGSRSSGSSASLVVLLPLREVSLKEAQALAEFKGLLQPAAPAPSVPGGVTAGDTGTAAPGKGSSGHGGSVNALAQGFVDAMQANLPASIFTVLRTASHLTAFDFNEPAAAGPAAAAAAAVAAGARASGSRAVGSGGGSGPKAPKGVSSSAPNTDSPPAAAAAAAAAAGFVDQGASGGAEFSQAALPPRLCSVCDAPLPSSKRQAADNGADMATAVTAVTGIEAAAGIADETGLCYCCDRYILRPLAAREGLGREEARMRLESLLPPPVWPMAL